MDEDSEKALVAASQAQQGPTLLPSHVAHAVSFATRSSSLALRLGSRLGFYSLDFAKVTTMSSLEVARGAVEGIFSRAGRDTLSGTRSQLATADAETVIEKSLEMLHLAFAQATFWTSAGFQISTTSLSTATDVSQLVLASLDHLFGSTDSSRAIASIITLIRREFQNPATGAQGQKVGVMDLVLALGAFAYLQQNCWKSPEEESKRNLSEEVIWDVVVLDDGQRIDVHEQSLSGVHPGAYNRGLTRAPEPQELAFHDSSSDEEMLSRLRTQISRSLSPDTSVSISSSVSKVHTITVDVKGTKPFSLPRLPGAEIVETRPVSAASSHIPPHLQGDGGGRSHRIVYKIERNKLRNTSFFHDGNGDSMFEPEEAPDLTTSKGLGLRIGPSSNSSSDSSPPTSPMQSPKSLGFSRQGFSRTNPSVSSAEQNSDTHTSQERNRLLRPKSRTNIKRSAADLASQQPGHAANQKRPRASLGDAAPTSQNRKASQPVNVSKKPLPKQPSASSTKPSDKKTGLKQVLKGHGPSISQIWSKDSETHDAGSKPKPPRKSSGTQSALQPSMTFQPPTRRTQNPVVPKRPVAAAPDPLPRSSSRASHVSVRDRRRDSVVSQTDAYSINAHGAIRPASPSIVRSEFSIHDSASRQRADANLSIPPSPRRGHRRAGSHVPSLYSLATNDSQTSLVLSSYYQKSAYNTSDALNKLRQEGVVDGTFPTGNLLRNITRYMRFSSASYGSRFLKFMGISNDMPALKKSDNTHMDVRHFLHHTESDASNMLLASIVDPQGGTDSTGATGTGVPLVHYISLDHEAKAVVLACRGTLGFEDVLADLVCDYDRLTWRGRQYRVHKGIHASARRVLFGDDGKVLVTLREALSEFPDYGLILCGHSLGGGVTSLLGVMLSEPNPNGTGFVTTYDTTNRMIGNTPDTKAVPDLPAGRRIHVYTYGPPGTMSRSLSKITRGLITTVVHGSDLVPHLSLGVLHDFQSVAHSFRTGQSSAKAEIRRRIWSTLQDTLTFRSPTAAPIDQEDLEWMKPALEALREGMKGEKLMPPGEVFTIETQRVLRRDAFLADGEDSIGRPAKRIVLKYVRDVEARFDEMRFGRTMLFDHSPGRYEQAMNMLRLGVAE